MRDKFIKFCLALTDVLAAILFIGSINAYENGNISGIMCFWQVMVSLLLVTSTISLGFIRVLLNEYTELQEDFDDYLDVEEAEEVIIPDEPFKFTRTPEFEEREVKHHG